MCDTATIHQAWVTPESSKHLTSKAIILHPGQSMPKHSTGQGREEVIVCLEGPLELTIGNEARLLFVGDTAFVPENTEHSLINPGEDNAAYVYVVTKKR